MAPAAEISAASTLRHCGRSLLRLCVGQSISPHLLSHRASYQLSQQPALADNCIKSGRPLHAGGTRHCCMVHGAWVAYRNVVLVGASVRRRPVLKAAARLVAVSLKSCLCVWPDPAADAG